MNSYHAACCRIFTLGIVAVLHSAAFAHIGIGSVSGFASGLNHPITGIDHLIAMLGIGIWAGQRGGKSVWALPLASITAMAIGGTLGAAAISMPFVEGGILLSVLALGVFVAVAVCMPMLLCILIVSTFAMWHGHAQGTEMPLTASGMTYAAGFLTTTAFLQFFGVIVGVSARRESLRYMLRYCGAAMIMMGLYLLML